MASVNDIIMVKIIALIKKNMDTATKINQASVQGNHHSVIIGLCATCDPRVDEASRIQNPQHPRDDCQPSSVKSENANSGAGEGGMDSHPD
jgi:hypothetical protein